MKTLGICEIDTWLGLEHYVRRGYASSFELIDRLGHRVKDLRERMLAVLEVVQTSALVAQASATRAHTSLLRVGLIGGLLIGGKFIMETFEKIGALLKGTELEPFIREGIAPVFNMIGSVAMAIGRLVWLIAKPALKIVTFLGSEIGDFIAASLTPLFVFLEARIEKYDQEIGIAVVVIVACWALWRIMERRSGVL